MRTNIEIDDRLMKNAMRCSGSKTKRGTVETALRLLVQTRAQAGIRQLRGKIQWQGDLDSLRASRAPESWVEGERHAHSGHDRLD
jgi:Arc/MetJ family transcription regulator